MNHSISSCQGLVGNFILSRNCIQWKAGLAGKDSVTGGRNRHARGAKQTSARSNPSLSRETRDPFTPRNVTGRAISPRNRMVTSQMFLDIRLFVRYAKFASLAIARRNDRILLVWSHALLSDPSGFFFLHPYARIFSLRRAIQLVGMCVNRPARRLGRSGG